MQARPLLSYFQTRRDEMIQLLGQHVSRESPSTDKKLCDLFARQLAERLANLGVSIELVPDLKQGEHVVAHFSTAGTPADAAPILVLCHYDTVWPAGTVAERPFRVAAERAYGPGAFDMKTSLVLVEYAIRAIRDLELELPRPIVALFTSDEEIGSPSGRALIEEQARRAAFVLVMEPPVDFHTIKAERKGIGFFAVDISGRPAHAGAEPERGISAISEMAHQILALNALNDPANGTTVNVGVVRGGSRPNVVAATARLEIDVRTWQSSAAERLTQTIYGLQPYLAGAQLKISGGFNRPPMQRSPATDAMIAQTIKLAADLGLALQAGATGGGSDGNFTAALGIPTLDGLGVPGAGAHAIDEQVDLSALTGRAALLSAQILYLEPSN